MRGSAFRKVAALVLMAFVAAAWGPARAAIPEPPNVFHGAVTLNGLPLLRGTVVLQVAGQPGPSASCAIGFIPGPANGYALKVVVDALEPRAPGTARPGDSAEILVDGQPAAQVIIGPRGSIQQLDLNLTAPHALIVYVPPSGLPNPVASGGRVNFYTEAADNQGHAVSYSWTALCPGLGAGSLTDPNAQSTAWTAPENFLGRRISCAIGVRAADGQGLTAEASFTQYVEPSPAPLPVALASAAPNPSACQQEVAFDATGSYHSRPDRHIVLYEWDFDYDGTAFTADATGPTAAHVHPGPPGPRTAALRVTDDGAPPISVIGTVVVSAGTLNRPPTADAGGPYRVDSGGTLLLDGGGSGDPDSPCGDGVTSWEWDLDGDNDFADASGATVLLSWAEVQAYFFTGSPCGGGQRSVKLRVTDGRGASAESLSLLTLNLTKPVPAASAAPNPALCGQTVSFDGSMSCDPRPGGAIVLYEWDFDYDGATFTADASGVQASHAYGAMGAYTAALQVTNDAQPAESVISTFAMTVAIDNQPPSASAGGPYALKAGEPLNLDGSGSTDPDEACGDAVVDWGWDTDGDGQFDDATGRTVSLPWSQVETLVCGGHCLAGQAYPISLRVSDRLGAEATASTTFSMTYLLFSDTFSHSGRADPDWLLRGGLWSLAGRANRYYQSLLTKIDRAVLRAPPEGGMASGSIEAKIKISRSFLLTPNVLLLFAYQSPTRYRYVRLIGAPTNKVILGQVGMFGTERGGIKASRRIRFIPLNRWLQARLDLHSDGLARFFLNGVSAVSYPFVQVPVGNLGLQAVKCVSYVDDYKVWHGSVLPWPAPAGE